MTKKGLGRALDSIMSTPSAARQGGDDGLTQIAISEVHPSPYQPRRHFDDEALADLAASIRSQGILQPIVVRPRPQGQYELIAGERRWRAAQLAELTAIPAVIKTVSDEQASALALIENMQREDLNALEEALGLARLRDEFELTQQQIADAVGKSRAAVANLLRLVNLGQTAKKLLSEGVIDMGHARCLLGLEGITQDQVALEIGKNALSVRQTEALIRKLTQRSGKATPKAASKDPDTLRLEQQLTDRLGAPVSITHSNQGSGQLVIRYSTLDELDGILRHLGSD